MTLSAHERQCLAEIESELSADRRLVTLARCIGKRAARLRWTAAVVLRWTGFPLVLRWIRRPSRPR